jgi:hypothetical protein
MAYANGQPWDSSLSYSKGQDCYYKGLHYLYWHPTENSTAGVPPNEEMKLFTATDYTSPYPWPTEQRSDRAWILFSNYNNYEIKELQPIIRGTGSQPQTAIDSLVYDTPISFYFQNFQKTFGVDATWSYYQNPIYQPPSMGVSTDYGVAKPSFGIPATEGDWNVSSQDDYLPFDPKGGTLPNIFYPTISEYLEDDNHVFKVSYPVDPFKTIIGHSKSAMAVGIMNNFDRTVSYTLYVTETDNTVIPPVVTNTTINGTINSGHTRDNWTNTVPENLYTYPIVSGHTVSMTITLNSMTPRFWV